jgi:hypothetical protein
MDGRKKESTDSKMLFLLNQLSGHSFSAKRLEASEVGIDVEL